MSYGTYNQYDSRWGNKNYNGSSSMAAAGCGPTSCANILHNLDSSITPITTMKYMQSHGYAIRNNGTAHAGIPACLKYFNAKDVREVGSMSAVWKYLAQDYGAVFLMGAGTVGGITWTTSGHFIAIVGYKVKDGKHYVKVEDCGGRGHDGWYCYETKMKGKVRKVWVCDAQPKPIKPVVKPELKTYTGEIAAPVIKKGSKGAEVKKLQKFLNWYEKINLTIDGSCGSKTEYAIKVFQKTEGLTVDGSYGSKSASKAKAYSKNNPTPAPAPSTDNLPKKCIDVSYWQGKISVDNWKKVKKTCGYAICRSSYTSQSKFALSKDSTFATNFKNAQAAGLRVGAYHYSQAITVAEAKKEAEFMCKILKDYKPDFYVVCDFEYGGRLNSKIGKKASDIANAFCDVVKAHGYQPCIYANTSTLTKALTKPKYPVWVAQYNTSCSYRGDKVMWQYTSSGKVNGVGGKVDLSHVYKVPPIQGEIKPSDETAQPETPAQPVQPEQSVVIAKTYSGKLPSIHVQKTASQVIKDALKWGRWIVSNNIFHYGEYGKSVYITPSSKYYANGKYRPIYNVTHSSGCHFCGTNKRKKNNKATKLGYKGENWEHTYVCNTFVTAMYAHGGMESTTLNKCRAGKCVGMTTAGRSIPLDNSKNWTYKGKLPIKDLKAGDVLVSGGHMQCVYKPVSSKKVKIIEATSYIGKYRSKASDNSIHIVERSPYYKSVYRFTGKVDANIPIRYGEYSDRVVLWQKFLNWAGFNVGEADGKFYTKTLAATKDFQSKTKLTVDGVIGKATLAAAKTYTK